MNLNEKFRLANKNIKTLIKVCQIFEATYNEMKAEWNSVRSTEIHAAEIFTAEVLVAERSFEDAKHRLKFMSGIDYDLHKQQGTQNE